MGKLSNKLQPAVKKETLHVILYCVIGTAVMWLVFPLLCYFFPDTMKFDYKVFVGGILGSLVAILNFFLMAITVQKVAATEDEGQARSLMKLSYSRRLILQIAWIVIAIFAPIVQPVAGILPLLFPGMGIKVMGIINFKRGMKQG